MNRSLLLFLLVGCLALSFLHPTSAETEKDNNDGIIGDEDEEVDDYELPDVEAFFVETFSDGWDLRWEASADEKYAEGEWEVGRVEDASGIQSEQGLIVKGQAKHHAISAKFDDVFDPASDADLVIQYDVRFHNQLNCGGAYVKVLAADGSFVPAEFNNESPYIIMFGPDKCGETNKVHFIFRHQNPVTGEFEEKHLVEPPKIKSNELTHLYTLVIRRDNTYEIFIDQSSAKQGSLLTDFDPPVNPPAEIPDPEDLKPDDWVDEEEIPDPEASKPEDWDEDAPMQIVDEDDVKPEGWLDNGPETIPDPEAIKPDDWDDDLDGEYEPPIIVNPLCEEIGCGEWQPNMIPNPAYKGKWIHPMIPNPEYKGEFVPRNIPNPAYFVDENPKATLNQMGAIGIEIWTMQEDIEFDNILVDYSLESAKEFGEGTWGVKHPKERAAQKYDDEFEDEGSFFERLFKDMTIVTAGITMLVGVISFFIILKICSGGEEERTEPEEETQGGPVPLEDEAVPPPEDEPSPETETEPVPEDQ